MTTLSKLFQVLAFGALMVAVVFLLSLQLASAQVACPANPHWTGTVPPINADHVFCGEIRKNGTAAGFHSRPGGVNPATVANVVVNQPPNTNGIYGGNVILVNPNGPNPAKFSAIFPDSCSQAEVVQSILYAHANPVACPAGAPGWATCGMNRPNPATPGHCVGDDATTRFFIAFATLGNGNINTAFPLR
ncbi:EndoU domain-containing protein [Thalassospira lucentensis]|uniref:EndoU domain-containing protein n=1 Tax=Thalassospira lucentensis TaxID=168935 RepID=UPI003AA91910